MLRFLACLICVNLSQGLAQTFLERFDHAPDLSNNWVQESESGSPTAGYPTITYTTGTLNIQAPNACINPGNPSDPGVSIGFLSNEAFVGDMDVSFRLYHGGYGRTSVGLWSVNQNQRVIGDDLDTDDTAYLFLSSGTYSTQYEYPSAPYMNKWITLRIQVTGGQVNFYADNGSGAQLLQTWPAPVSSPPDSYYINFGVGSVCWKSGPNNTSFEWIEANSLAFPLKGKSAASGDMHYTSATAPVNSVFDHSMKNTAGNYGIYQNGCDGVVMAFDGTVAQYNPSTVDGCMSSYTLNQTEPYTPITPLLKPTMNYRGAGGINTYLNYDSHPGIDYQAALKTPVYAAVSGTVHYPPRIIGIEVGKTPAQAYHVMEIVPDYEAGFLPPYVVYYLHLDTYPCPVSSSKVPCQTVGSVTTTDPDPLSECQGSAGYNGSSVALPLQDGAHVTAGCAVALSGWAGLTEPQQAHLHFEVQTIVPASAVSTQAGAQEYAACVDPNITAIVGKTGYDCLPVDPYGWTGTSVQCSNQATSGDPYWCLSNILNVPLWK